jgi:hypothetical protein
MASQASFFVINAITGEPVFGPFPSFSSARKEAGHLTSSFSFPLSVGRF